jgi:circadian clock protein KaiB
MEVVMKLYISGPSESEERVVARVQAICHERLPTQVRLEVIDLTATPELAPLDGIWATPTLVKVSPGPVRKVFGDLSDKESVISMLDLSRGSDPTTAVPYAAKG